MNPMDKESHHESSPGTELYCKLFLVNCMTQRHTRHTSIHFYRALPLTFLSLLTEFRRSPYNAYEDEHIGQPKSKDGVLVKEERYSPWGPEQDPSLNIRTDSPLDADARDIYNSEQLVPTPASYQPYRYRLPLATQACQDRPCLKVN